MKTNSPKQCMALVLGVFFVVLFSSVGFSQVPDADKLSKEELQKKVAALELGFGSYVVGKELSKEQLALAQIVNSLKAYPGTIKFKDKDLFIIADEQSNVVIALYKRNKKASKADFKNTISELMMLFGEPTAEAHGKALYWNYSDDGLINEELYRAVKSQGRLSTLPVYATVKFSSSQNVETMTSMIEKMEEKAAEKKGTNSAEEEMTSDNYVMIQSDMLTQKYMEQ